VRLDIPTLILTLTVGFLLLALQLWVAQRSALRQPELQRWSQGCWAMLAGLLMAPMRAVWPVWISAMLGNSCFIVGLTLFSAALWRHLLDRPLPRWQWASCVAGILLSIGIVGQDLATRTVVVSGVFLVILVPALRLMMQKGWPQGGSIRTATVTLSGFALAMVLRSADAVLRPDNYVDVLRGGWVQELTFMVGFMCLLGAGFGFVLACFERVARRMEEMATLDGLTGCVNRSTTDALFAHNLERGRREGSPVAFALLDLDHFKLINDRYGHMAGDNALRAFAQEVRSRLRSSDVLGRMGGEEFALVLPSTDAPGAARIVEQIRAAVEALTISSPNGERFHLTVSAGVVVAASDSGLSDNRLYMLADRALYRAKELGRNRVQLGGEPVAVPPQKLVAVAGAGPEAAGLPSPK
jgi:diguanylate cyclase (GGDEF)-like protein